MCDIKKIPPTSAQRPTVGQSYIKKGTLEVYQVRAIGPGHVVCDREYLFTREEFANEFREFDIAKGSPA